MLLFVQELITKDNNNMKRDSRLTADITEEAHDILIAKCKEHERGKGFLLEKMIRKFCSEPDKGGNAPEQTEQQKAMAEYVKPKKPVKRFVPPTVEQVREYCDSRCNNIDPQNFVAHYTTNGWMRGKAKIKDWKACVVTWENKDKTPVKSNESLKGKW